jgi:CheY-like chemotaxis protein
MALCEAFDELGLVVVGPYSRVSEAMNAIRTNQIDAAVLDINLGGEMVYPLADVLAAARIPFAFLTGYAAEEIRHRYADVPILQKPIEPGMLRSVFSIPGAGSELERAVG